jgi:hypothetical protein
MLIVRPYIDTWILFSLVEFEPHLVGDLLLKYYEQESLWMGGTSKSYM